MADETTPIPAEETPGLSRRGFLIGAGGLGAGGLAASGLIVGGAAGAASGFALARATTATADVVYPYFDQAHQGGIQTEPQKYSVLMTYDLTTSSRAEVQVLLARWTAAIAQMVKGQPIGNPEPPGAQAVAQAAGITPIVCVGETLTEREAGLTEEVVKRQLAAVIHVNGHCISEIVVAYEPVWAIGTGKTASPEEAQSVHAVLRSQLKAATAHFADIKILYGGSMNAANAVTLLAQPDIDGGLIGGASLKAADFLTIIAAAQ